MNLHGNNNKVLIWVAIAYKWTAGTITAPENMHAGQSRKVPIKNSKYIQS